MMTTSPKVASDLPADATFFNVNGVPVALFDEVESWAFDTNPARPFDFTSVMSDGIEIDKSAFINLLPS